MKKQDGNQQLPLHSREYMLYLVLQYCIWNVRCTDEARNTATYTVRKYSNNYSYIA